MSRGRRIRRIVMYALGVLALLIVVLNWTAGRLPVTPHARGSFLELQGGLRVRYLETPGPEPAVLMLHGQPGTAEDWEYVAPRISGHG